MVNNIIEINEKANKLLYEQSILDCFNSMAYYSDKNEVGNFMESMPNFIIKLSQIIAKSKGEPLPEKTYVASIDYLCIKVIKSQLLHHLLKDIYSNNYEYTHNCTSSDLNAFIKECKHQYNILIESLITTTNIYILNNFKLNIVDETPYTWKEDFSSYKMIKDVKYRITFSNAFTYDRYAKTYNHTLTVYWPDAHPGDLLKIKLHIGFKHYKKITNIDLDLIDLSNANSFKTFTIPLEYEDYYINDKYEPENYETLIEYDVILLKEKQYKPILPKQKEKEKIRKFKIRIGKITKQDIKTPIPADVFNYYYNKSLITK